MNDLSNLTVAASGTSDFGTVVCLETGERSLETKTLPDESLKGLVGFDSESLCAAAAALAAKRNYEQTSYERDHIKKRPVIPPERRSMVWQTCNAGADYYQKVLMDASTSEVSPSVIGMGPLSSYNGPLSAVAIKLGVRGTQALVVDESSCTSRLVSTMMLAINSSQSENYSSLIAGMSDVTEDGRFMAVAVYWPYTNDELCEPNLECDIANILRRSIVSIRQFFESSGRWN